MLKTTIQNSVLFLVFILASCQKHDKTYTMATSSSSGSYFHAANAISDVLKKEADINIEVLSGNQLSTGTNCELLLKKEVDFAFAQNDTELKKVLERNKNSKVKIRTVAPIYPEILFLCYPDSLNPTSLHALIEGKRVGMGPKTSGTANFLKVLFEEFNIDTTDFKPVYCSFSDNHLNNPDIDIACAITGFNNPRIRRILTEQHGKLYSIGELDLAFRGSAVDGFCMKYPRSRPYIIPRQMIAELPEKPVLTVAVDAVIWTRSDVSNDVVHDFVETLYNNSQLLVQKNEMFASLNEDFSTRGLHFPLHEGARMYFERDRPGFWERYAELIGVLFSILIAIYGLGRTWHRHISQRKKDHIDIYYASLLEVEKHIESGEAFNIQEEIEKIKQLKRKAYQLLMDEKLAADESFRIFVSFANEILESLKNQTPKT